MANRITVNPGFELGNLNGWEQGGTGVTLTNSAEQAHAGTKSGKAVATAGGSVNQGFFVAWADRGTITPGESLRLTIWVYATTAHTFNVGWDEYSSGDVYQTTVSSNIAHAGGGWQEFTVNGVPGGSSAKAQSFVRTGSAVNLTYYVDDASLDNPPGVTPVVSRRTVDGTKLAITYDGELDTGSVPATSAFTVTVAGSGRTVNSVALATGEESGSRHVVLTLASAVTAGQSVTVAYTAGASPIQGTTGSDAANYAAQAVTNLTGGSTVTTWLDEMSGSSPQSPATASTAGTGSSVLTQQTSPISPYSGTYFAKFTIGTGVENKFARITNTDPDWDEGTEVWWGGAFYFPSGYYLAVKNDSRLIDLNSFSDGIKTLYLAVWYNVTDDAWEFQRQTLIHATGAHEDVARIGTTWAMPEGQWNFLEVRSHLSRVDGLAINEIWLNGTQIQANTTHNFRVGYLMRSTQMGIGSTGSDQSPTPLTLYGDKFSLSATQVGVSVPTNTVVPAVTGTAQVGSTLSCSTGTWTGSPTSYAYQWQRADDSDFSGTVTDIPGATSNLYSITTADLGKYLRCRVTASN